LILSGSVKHSDTAAITDKEFETQTPRNSEVVYVGISLSLRLTEFVTPHTRSVAPAK
jgi:hypothetical protein